MTHPRLHIHAYTGRENGIMIVGTKEELAEFASELTAAIGSELRSTTPEWPRRVLTVNGESPFSDRDFPISFHEQTEPLPAQLQKRPRHAPPGWLFLGIAFFTLVGMLSLPIWLIKVL